MNREEIKALISLLDDPDDTVYQNIEERILSFGDDIIANLEEAWEHSFNHILQTRIEAIIHKIQFNSLCTSLKTWVQNPDAELLEGAILVARYQYPDLDEKVIYAQIDQLRKDVWLEINDQLTALEKVHVMNKVLFDIHKFSGNKRNYHAPQNSYINNVLETKKGSPLSLSFLYVVIAHALKIPIYGINLPEHFILGYSFLPKSLVNSFTYDDILFYINPFNKGQVFSRSEIDRFIDEIKFEKKEAYYLPCTNLEMIQRLLRNLTISYQKLGYPEKERELMILLKENYRII